MFSRSIIDDLRGIIYDTRDIIDNSKRIIYASRSINGDSKSIIDDYRSMWYHSLMTLEALYIIIILLQYSPLVSPS
jgi:hypothetical protein